MYGRHFCLYTDHKPLLSLLSGDRQISSQSSARIQRWALTLAGYEYKLKYKASQDHENADGLSRLPLADLPASTPLPPELILLMESISNSPVTAGQISSWTKADPILSKVLQFIRLGWPDTCPDDESFKPYWSKQSELSILDGCILWSSHVVVPPKGRQDLLSELHEGHFGISKAKSRARLCVWWPGIDKDIEKTVKDCTKCQEHRNSPAEALLHPWPWPSRPWSRLHMDFAGPVNNIMFLIIIDAYSKWIEVFPMSNITATTTIQRLTTLFAQFGIPDTIVSDNGPTFVSHEFESYLQHQGIRHVTSAPYHPASNGLAERAVRIVKNGLKRNTTGTLTERLACLLFNYRISPHGTTGVSPSELMFNRVVKSKLDLVKPNITSHVEHKQFQQKTYHDTHAKERLLLVGEEVYFKDFTDNGKWKPGWIVKNCGAVARLVKSSDGKVVRRHVDHIRKRYPKDSDIGSSSDDFMYPPSNGATVATPPPPRNNIIDRSPYPTRNRRPPDRYAPLVI